MVLNELNSGTNLLLP